MLKKLFCLISRIPYLDNQQGPYQDNFLVRLSNYFSSRTSVRIINKLTFNTHVWSIIHKQSLKHFRCIKNCDEVVDNGVNYKIIKQMNREFVKSLINIYMTLSIRCLGNSIIFFFQRKTDHIFESIFAKDALSLSKVQPFVCRLDQLLSSF